MNNILALNFTAPVAGHSERLGHGISGSYRVMDVPAKLCK